MKHARCQSRPVAPDFPTIDQFRAGFPTAATNSHARLPARRAERSRGSPRSAKRGAQPVRADLQGVARPSSRNVGKANAPLSASPACQIEPAKIFECPPNLVERLAAASLALGELNGVGRTVGIGQSPVNPHLLIRQKRQGKLSRSTRQDMHWLRLYQRSVRVTVQCCELPATRLGERLGSSAVRSRNHSLTQVARPGYSLWRSQLDIATPID